MISRLIPRAYPAVQVHQPTFIISDHKGTTPWVAQVYGLKGFTGNLEVFVWKNLMGESKIEGKLTGDGGVRGTKTGQKMIYC